MRNMSNIPKLPALTERSSCCSVKVGAHNKEECERTLTSQWPSCPATLRSMHTASAGGLLPETQTISRVNGGVWQKKKEFKSVSSAQNGRAEENAQRRGDENTRTRKSFVARAQTPPITQNSSAVGETKFPAKNNLPFKNDIFLSTNYLSFKKL